MCLVMTKSKRKQRLLACALTRLAFPELDTRSIEVAADDPNTIWDERWWSNHTRLWASYADPMDALAEYYRYGVLDDYVNRTFCCIDPLSTDTIQHVPEHIRNMAEAAYQEDEIDADRLRIMWDALEDIGVDSRLIRQHLLCDSGHWKSCWVLDLLRGYDGY